MEYKKAMFAMGCFWSPQLTFSKVKGVVKTTVGYSGGHVDDPTYKDVCSNTTGHAETILIEFDPKVVSYEELLGVFWENHNPTTRDRQGPDVGNQYRSVIFYFNTGQKKKAEKSLKERQKEIGKKIVTEIVKVGEFYPAEDYHQNYLEKNGRASCGI